MPPQQASAHKMPGCRRDSCEISPTRGLHLKMKTRVTFALLLTCCVVLSVHCRDPGFPYPPAPRKLRCSNRHRFSEKNLGSSFGIQLLQVTATIHRWLQPKMILHHRLPRHDTFRFILLRIYIFAHFATMSAQLTLGISSHLMIEPDPSTCI